MAGAIIGYGKHPTDQARSRSKVRRLRGPHRWQASQNGAEVCALSLGFRREQSGAMILIFVRV
jgi:hypothetical protein